MSEYAQTDTQTPTTRNAETLRHRAFRTFVGRLSSALECGSLSIELPGGDLFQAQGAHAGPDAEILVNRTRAARRALFGGSLGLADSISTKTGIPTT